MGTGIATEVVPLDRLTAAPWNPRLIKDKRFKQLCKSLEADPDFLQERPVLATCDGVIYAGNMRYRAAQQLGWASIPARLADIPEQLAKERALRDNNQFGEWVDQDLAEMLVELKLQDSDLELLGFDEKELNRLLDSVGGNGETPAPEQAIGEQYLVLVECASEGEQAELLERFTEEGLKCRALLS